MAKIFTEIFLNTGISIIIEIRWTTNYCHLSYDNLILWFDSNIECVTYIKDQKSFFRRRFFHAMTFKQPLIYNINLWLII